MNNKYIEQINNQTSRGGNNMFQTMKKRMKNEKGLTLIELLAVIVILAIIAAIAIPAIGNIIANSKYNAVKSDALNTLNAAQLYFLDHSDKNIVKVEDGDNGLVKTGYLEQKGKMPDGATVTKTGGKLTITAENIQYDGGKTLTFKEATIEGINGDTQKGSAAGNKEIAK